MTLKSQTVAQNLIGASVEQMQDVLASIGVPEKQLVLRTKQIFHWIYIRGATQFSQMASIGKDLQTALAQNFTLDRPEIVTEQISIDGTRKWLLRFPQARAPAVEVETVYIPESDRGTLCVSSQVGCSFNCSFCYTGTQQMMKNLRPGEILAQVMIARDRLSDYQVESSGGFQPPSIIEPPLLP
jgi:23S rRNA (adenine2503-C2)-methyltransferase